VIDGPKLHLVSGKGGVGKTWVAAALARHLAAQGARTLFVSFDDTADTHPVFGCPLGYEPVAVAPNLSVSRVEARAALLEYVRRRMTFSMVYEAAISNPLVGRFLSALPIFEELMCLGKLYDLSTDPDSPWDQVVFDAPATGHCQILLNIPKVAAKTLVAGPIYRSALEIQQMLTDPTIAQLLIVTLPEETPVREAQQLASYAQSEAGLRCPAFLVNRVLPDRFSTADTVQLQAQLDACTERWAEPVAQALALDTAVAGEQRGQLASLQAVAQDLAMRVLELPELVEASPEGLIEPVAQVLA
jgi:anion-transporting  ArsA/GET3 family ATPase